MEYAASQNTRRFIIEYSTNASDWRLAGEVTAINQTDNQQYNYRHYTAETGKIYYRLQIEDHNGAVTYSPVITVSNKETGSSKVFPTVLTANLLQVTAGKPLLHIKIMDSNGRMVFSKQLGGQEGYFSITLPSLSKGMYWVQLQSRDGNETVKVVVE